MEDFTRYNENKKHLRRNLKINGTPAEGRLWRILKNKQVCGLRFRRQVDIDNYILDFYCSELRLAIELDGEYHFHGAKPEMDCQRDEELFQKYNIRTIRFEDKIVFEQPDVIIERIKCEKELSESQGQSFSTPQSLCDSSPNLGEQLNKIEKK